VMTMLVMLLLVTRSVDGMEDVVSGAVESVTERVILAFVVVISHVKLAILGRVDSSTGLSLDTYFLLYRRGVVVVLGVGTRCTLSVRVLNYGIGSATIITFGNVDL
jgi:hypothetical protein